MPAKASKDGTSDSKRIAILQSSYIPWKGYFNLIRAVDEFILYDDTQFTRRDWRNRNKIKTARGLEWITIPVQVKGKYFQKIRETRVSDPAWAKNHWARLKHTYNRAPFFRKYEETIQHAYEQAAGEPLLSRINYTLIRTICGILDINTRISWSTDYELQAGKTVRLVGLCAAAGASRYLSGPSAQDYLDSRLFAEAGIELQYADYSGYPEYPQLHGSFEHGVTVLDLIFNTGPEASRYLKKLG